MFRCLKRGPGFYGYLWRLTGPIALQNLITFSLGLIDTLMVSWLGNTQMAAVTTANVPVFLLISIVFGVQSGLGILVSQYWGKKDMESISRAIGVAAMLGTGITLVLAVVLFLWPVQIMDLLSNKHELSVLGAPYLKLIGFSYVFNMLSSIYVSAMRSAENAGFGMKLFGVSTLLNTGMNYILIFGKCGFPALGIQGAAIATLLSRVAEFLICLVCALRSRILPLDLAAFFRPGWEMLRRFVKYSTPVILNETAWGLGNSLLTVILGYTDNSVEMLAANAVMGNLNRQTWEDLWNSPEAEKVRRKVRCCNRNCWMIGSVSPAMHKYIATPALWVAKHKLKSLLGMKYSMYENPVCCDYRDGKVTKEQLDRLSTCDVNAEINNGLSDDSKAALKGKRGEDIVNADVARQGYEITH